ncbi:secreted RxLR effector protein 161-like [Arachis hypogaea]|uniref:secreted RxLR effector protein 161-like n=1 Tax=Arachis hypogaea TaxID=3818 RepID=UPI003B22447D
MLVVSPNKDQIQKLKAQLVKEFDMKDVGPVNKILGICPSSEAERMKMSQVLYASVVESLMYAMICTSTDIAQTVTVVSQFMVDPNKEHWIDIKRFMRYIKGSSTIALCFGGSKSIVNRYVDSDFAGDIDKRKSTIRYVFILVGGAVSWLSKLQTVVSISTIEAEYMAATQACKEAIWIQRLMENSTTNNRRFLCIVKVIA